MSVEDVIKEVKVAAKEIIPSHISISKIAVESSNVILYTKDTDFISGNNDSVRTLAQKVRKRIIVRADSSARSPIISAKPKISDIIPEEAEVQDIIFDEVNGDVIIEAINPGKAIGKQGSVLNEIRKQIGWNPVVIRHPPMKSQKLTEIRKFLLEPKTASKRKDFLKHVGKKVFRDTKISFS